MTRRGRLALVFLVVALGGPARAEDWSQLNDDDFQLLLVKRKLPVPRTLDDLAGIVSRLRRVGASNAEIAEYMSVQIDNRLLASNKPGGESLFNPYDTKAVADRKARWQAVDDVMNGNDGQPGKPIADGMLGARMAEAAWENKVGNCCESANVALEVLRRAGIPARLFNTSTGGAHEFAVIGLNPNADPNDPTTWGDDARVVDGWIGHSLTPQETFENKHIFNGQKTSPDGKPLVSDQTTAYSDPGQQKKFQAMGNKGLLRVTVVADVEKDDKSGKVEKPVAGATVRLSTDPPKEEASTDQGLATFQSYPGKVTIDVIPPKGSNFEAGHGETTIEVKRTMQVSIKLKSAPPELKLAITAPADGATVKEAETAVTGTASGGEIEEVTLDIGGTPIMAQVKNGQFAAKVTLPKGQSILQARAGSAKSKTVTVTLGEKPASPGWEGTWQGKLHVVSVGDKGPQTKDEAGDLVVTQKDDTIFIKASRGGSTMQLKLDSKDPTTATWSESGPLPVTPTSKGTQKRSIIATLKDGRLHLKSDFEMTSFVRASEKDPWTEKTFKGNGTGDFERANGP